MNAPGRINGRFLVEDFTAARVNHQVVEGKHLLLGRHAALVAAQHGPDAGNQHPGAEGLGDIIIRPGFQPGDNVRFLPLRRKHDNGDCGALLFALQPPAHFEPVYFGQHQIKQHQVRRFLLHAGKRLFAGHGAHHLVPFLLQVIGDQFQDVFIIFNNEYSCFGFAAHGAPFQYPAACMPLYK